MNSVTALTAAVQEAGGFLNPLYTEINRCVVGQKYLVERLVIGLLANGHVLLEGVPGLAKTLSVKTLATALHVRFSRIQFTPDMLPADVVGTQVYNPAAGSFSIRRGPVFAESSFAKQIAMIEAGQQTGPIKVGNLDSVRTLADVRDAVRAYWLLLDKCTPGEVYNIGGCETMTIGALLDILKSMATCPVAHEVDPARLRPSDVTLQIPDTSKFFAATGWVPTISARQTLQDLLDYHRRAIRCDQP